MAVDPISALLMLGGSFLGGLGQQGPQERQSYRGVGGADPTEMLPRAFGAISGLGDALTKQASQGVKLRSSYVQSPPTFAGGGMPMPIGLSGRDPALSDPSLLSKAGLFGGQDGGSLFGGQPHTSIAPDNSGSGSNDSQELMAALSVLGHDFSNAGAGSRDPYLLGSRSLGPKGPGMDPRSYEDPGPGWNAFFSGNPGGAFYGGGVTGGVGSQTGSEGLWYGKGRAR